MASKKFRNLNVEFRDIMGLSVSQRLDMLRSEEGQGILAGFTPAQLVDMFPRYYSERLPSVGKSLSRVSGGKVGEETIQTAQRETIQRKPVGGTSGTPTTLPRTDISTAERIRRTSTETVPGWQKSLQEKTGISIPTVESSGTADQKSLDLIRKKEGFIPTPKWDRTAYRVGYGSDTITREDGSVEKVVPGMKISREDAERDLKRRMPEFQRKGIINYIGEDAWNKLNSDTKAAVTSLAYNYGSIAKLESLKKALTENNKEAIAAAVESYASHNNGINRGRRNEEAAMIRRSTDDVQQSQVADINVPQNLDPKFVEEFNKFGPVRKKKIIEAIGKLGEGDTEKGVTAFNELYRASPEKVTGVASRPSSGENLVEMRNQNARRNLPITGSLNDQLNYAATQAGVKVEVFSGGQERPIMINGKMTSPRHNAGNAADIKLYTTDEKGNKRYLDMRNPEDAAKMKKFTSAAVHAGATGVGAGPGYMGNSSIHIGGGTTAAWGGAPWIKEALNEGLTRRQSQPLNLEDWKKQQQEKKEQQNNITQASPEAETEARAETYRSRFGTLPQQKPVGNQEGTSTALPALTPQQQQPPTATPEKKEEPVPQQAFALGGETEAQGPLTAYAIDKDKMRRDDTIVTDGRVRFTMNSEKESMKYDPDTGQVKIDQARGEARQKINANDLQPVEKQQEQLPTSQQDQQVIQNQATQVQSAPQQLPNSYDTTLDLTSDIFKTSSFKRAVAQSRFMKDNDPLGGHYDFGAYNIT